VCKGRPVGAFLVRSSDVLAEVVAARRFGRQLQLHLGHLGCDSGAEEHCGMVPQWVSCGGGDELQGGQGYFTFVDRFQ
jgi:hypothetical protein